jgi:hypothetical protein
MVLNQRLLKKNLSKEMKISNLKNKYFLSKIIFFFALSISRRSKRAINGRAVSFFVEYLVVIDSTVYAKFTSLYGSLNADVLFQYIKIFYCHLVNGIDMRYKNSFSNDPDMTINIRLANILIYTVGICLFLLLKLF